MLLFFLLLVHFVVQLLDFIIYMIKEKARVLLHNMSWKGLETYIKIKIFMNEKLYENEKEKENNIKVEKKDIEKIKENTKDKYIIHNQDNNKYEDICRYTR